jgi:hypothetical protein
MRTDSRDGAGLRGLNISYDDIDTMSYGDLLTAKLQLEPLARRYHDEYAGVWYNNQSEVSAPVYTAAVDAMRKHGVSARLTNKYFAYIGARARQHYAREIQAAPLYHAVQRRLAAMERT